MLFCFIERKHCFDLYRTIQKQKTKERMEHRHKVNCGMDPDKRPEWVSELKSCNPQYKGFWGSEPEGDNVLWNAGENFYPPRALGRRTLATRASGP